MHQSFVTTAPYLRGWAEDSGANMRGSDLSSSTAVPGLWYYANIYPRGIYYYKEQGCDSQQVPEGMGGG